MSMKTISLRISDAQKGVIDAAAASCGRTRTAFIVESAIERAQNMLLDRREFILDGKQWDEFLALLDGTIDDTAMRRTMETVPAWEKN